MQAPPAGADHEKEDMRTFTYAPSTIEVPILTVSLKLFSARLIVTLH